MAPRAPSTHDADSGMAATPLTRCSPTGIATVTYVDLSVNLVATRAPPDVLASRTMYQIRGRTSRPAARGGYYMGNRGPTVSGGGNSPLRLIQCIEGLAPACHDSTQNGWATTGEPTRFFSLNWGQAGRARGFESAFVPAGSRPAGGSFGTDISPGHILVLRCTLVPFPS